MQVGKIISANQSVFSKTKNVLKESQNIANPLMQNIAQPKNLPMTTKPVGGKVIEWLAIGEFLGEMATALGMALAGSVLAGAAAVGIAVAIDAIQPKKPKLTNNNKIDNAIKNDYNKLTDTMNKEIDILSKQEGISREKAEEEYVNDIVATYPDKDTENRKGLNRIIGNDTLKLGLTRTLISPLYKTMQTNNVDERKKLMKDVPNAICFFGPKGTGKTFLANALMENYKLMGGNSAKIEFIDTDKEKEKQTIQKLFKEAKENYENTMHRQYTLVLADELQKRIMKEDCDGFVPERNEFFKSILKNCKQNGVIMLFTSNDLDKTDTSLIAKDMNVMSVPVEPVRADNIIDMIEYYTKLYELPFEMTDTARKELADAIETQNLQYKPSDIAAVCKSAYGLDCDKGSISLETMKYRLHTSKTVFNSSNIEQFEKEKEEVSKVGNLCPDARKSGELS